MTEHSEHGQNPETAFEHQDLSAKGVFSFLAGLAIVGVVIYFILLGMYRFLDRYEAKRQPPTSPLAAKVESTPHGVMPDARARFPEPRLEVNERTEIGDFRQQEADRLNSYGWVDQKAGVVHIPIDRAMQLIAKQGLPVLPQNGAPGKGAAPQQKTKGAAKPQAQADKK
jgi:hypothetical protein